MRRPPDDEGDHYAVLGVSRQAAVAEIRRAYRLLALRHHPDRAGPAGTAVFQRITRAYRALSDAGTRAAHDARLRAAEMTVTIGAGGNGLGVGTARGRGHRPTPQSPLIPRLTAPLEALIERAAARVATEGLIELLLTDAEARAGGTAAITLPRQIPCPTCGGCAQPGSIWCARCEFAGTVREEVTVCVDIPPLVADGVTFTVQVDPSEDEPPLRVRVRL